MSGLAVFAPEEQTDSDSLLLADPAGKLDDTHYTGDELIIERLYVAAEEAQEVRS
jgi:hypothetical protein